MKTTEYFIQYKTKHNGADGRGVKEWDAFKALLSSTPKHKIERVVKRVVIEEELEF